MAQSAPTPEALIAKLQLYFDAVDQSIDALTLAHREEGELVNLPQWMCGHRTTKIGHLPNYSGILLQIYGDPTLTEDAYRLVEVTTRQEIESFFGNWNVSWNRPVSDLANVRPMFWHSALVRVGDNPLRPPALDDQSLRTYGSTTLVLAQFSEHQGKEDALFHWTNRVVPRDDSGPNQPPPSYVKYVRDTLTKYRLAIKRKAWVERRIHRYINAHRDILLPAHTQCYYEHVIHGDDTFRKADFILQRELDTPPMLIELESPAYKIYKKSGEPTAQATHARNQITEWVTLIREDPKTNASGKMKFLMHPDPVRLVVMGRTQPYDTPLIKTLHDGTIFWTYEVLADQARRRLNNNYEQQCRIVDLPPTRPF